MMSLNSERHVGYTRYTKQSNTYGAALSAAIAASLALVDSTAAKCSARAFTTSGRSCTGNGANCTSGTAPAGTAIGFEYSTVLAAAIAACSALVAS